MIVLIVFPLTLLTEDQVKKFTAMGLKAAFVCEVKNSVGQGVMGGEYHLVYMSPDIDDVTVLQWREMFHSPKAS